MLMRTRENNYGLCEKKNEETIVALLLVVA